jgi:hypothetical protein
MTALPFRTVSRTRCRDLSAAELALWAPVRCQPQVSRWMQDRTWHGRYGAVFLGDSHAALLSHPSHGREDAYQWLGPLHGLNVGVPGSCPQHVLWQLRSGTLSQVQAQVVVVWLGANCLAPWLRPTVVAEAIRSVAWEAAQVTGATEMLALLPPCAPAYGPETRARCRALEDALHAVLPVIGPATVPRDVPHYYARDGVHLSAAGYGRLLPAVYQALRPRVSEQKTRVFRGQGGWSVVDALVAGKRLVAGLSGPGQPEVFP